MGRRVEELDLETQELLTASVAVPSLAVLVQELVYNSIDSEATCIAVRINVDRISRVQVVDNGCGVQNVVDLCEHAPTNKRRVSRHLYGTRRGVLYSIVKLCERVCVTTRRHNTTTTKIFSSYQEREIITEKRNRHSKGTTITIDNVFSNMPVRSASVSYMDLEQTKDTLIKIAVANPRVAITLKDIHSGTKIFQTQSSPNFSDNFLLYCHNSIDWQKLSQVDFDINGYKLKALLSKALNHKPKQLVYVNRRHIDDDRIKRFASDILTSALGSLDKRNQENGFPVFLILITCKPINVDMCFESNTFLEVNDWDSVFTLVYRCIASFLEAEQIPLNVTEEDLSLLPTPCPSLRSMLRVASPNVNIKSDKASRPRKSSSLAPSDAVLSKEISRVCDEFRASEAASPRKVVKETTLETPKKTNHSKFVPRKRVLNDESHFSTHHDRQSLNSKTWTLKTPEKAIRGASNKLFETPPFRVNETRLSKLQNAPVLNHLYEANEKLENVGHIMSPKTIDKTPALSRHPPSSRSSQKSLCYNKRRSSTPLCPSKSSTLKLNISPIEISKKRKEFLTPSVQTKRKRKHRASSTSVSKKQATKPELIFEDFVGNDEHRFRMETPRFILDGSKYTSSHAQTKGANLFGKNRDSGYHTNSRQGSAESPSYMYDELSASPLFGASSKEDRFSVSERKSDSETYDSIDHEKQPFKVFEDADVEVNESEKVGVTFDSSPHRFQVHWDETETLVKEVEMKPSSVIVDNTENVPKSMNAVFQVKQTAEDEPKTQKPVSKYFKTQPVPVIIVGHSRHPAEVLDCACSPLRIPVDRGCSPVNFTQLNIATSDDSDSNHTEANGIVAEHSENLPQEVSSEQNFSFDSFSEMNESILDCVDKKIDELTVKPDTPKKSFSSSNHDLTSTSLIKSPCLECHTQSVTKRLDFTSQACAKPVLPVDVANKENTLPEYQVSVPVPAATHLVANCAPWNTTGTKITIIKKSAPLDIRKWKSEAFETHGEGSWNIQKNPKHNMNFLLDATKFDREVFNGLQVIGQIDEKFIGCVTSEGLLVLIDQHAAHERVRLECMLDTVHKLGDSTKEVERKTLHTAIPVKVSKSDAEFVNHISSKLKHVGFEVYSSKYLVNVTAIPAFCFAESGILNIQVEDIVTAFHQTVQQIRESEGSNLTLPVKLVDYLHSKACHGAIRFGDVLTLEQCRVLIKQLGVCDLPFQCAHGRPSFAPIVKLKEKQTGQPKGLDVDPVCEELSFLKLRSRFRPS